MHEQRLDMAPPMDPRPLLIVAFAVGLTAVCNLPVASAEKYTTAPIKEDHGCEPANLKQAFGSTQVDLFS